MPESPDFISRLQIAVINARAKLGSGFTQDADRAGAYLEISNVLMSEANALAGSDPDTSQRYLDAARMIQEQAEITTYSGDNGIAAITGNLRAKLNNPETYKISLDEFSFLIDDSILRFFENVAEFGDKESISKNNILAVDGLAWDSLGLLDYFPGNAITYSFDANLGSSVWLNASAEQKAKLFGIDQSMGIIGKIELGAAIGFPQLFSLGKSPSAFGFTDPDEISLLQFGGEIIREDVHGRSWRLIKSQDGIVSIVDNNVKTVGTDIDNPVYGHTAYVDNGYDMANVGQQIGLKLAAILFPATLYRQFATVEVNPDTGQEYYILSPQAVDSIKNFMQADFGLLGTRFAYAEGQPVLTLADLQNASGTGAGGKISSNISVIADPDNPNVFTVIGSGPSLSGQGTRVVSVEVGKDSGGNEVINRSVVIELTSSGTIASAEISEAEQVRILNLAEAARIQAQIADFAHRSTSQQPELIYGDLGELIGVDDQVTGGGQTSDIGKAFLTAKVDANGNLTLEGHTTKLIAFDPRSRVARYQISAGVDEFGREVTQEWSLNLENDQYKYSGKTQTIDGALTITQDINGPTTIRLSNSPIHMDFVDGAQVIANTLGRYIAGDDVLTQTLTTAALNTIAANFGDVLNTLAFDSGIATSDNLSHAFDGIDAELLANIKSAGIGAVSSFLSAQLIDSLGIGGVPGELLNTAAGQAINVIITNLSNGAYVFKDLSRTSITNAAGSYVGNKLASEIADWDEVGEQIGAQIGSAIGATIASGIPVIGTAIGAFFGNLIGGLIGGIFTGAPKSGAILGFDEATGQFQVEAVWKEDGGKRAVARQLGNTAAASLNGILATIGGELLNGDDVEAGSYGMRKKAFVYWNDGTSSDNRIKFATASDLVEYGVMKAARDMQIIGGDIYAKRAFYLTMAQGAVTSSNNDGSGSDDGLSSTNVDFGLDLLVGNLAVADRLKVYLANSASINALIAAEPNSVFTTDWMIALSRASELGLLKRNTHDWDGGFSYLLSQGDVDARDVGFRFETSSRQGNGARVMYLDGAALEDTVDTGSKTVVQGGSEDDVLAALAGGSRDGAATGAAYHISNVFHGGAGDDHIVAGDTGDDLFGDDGNDVLVGGQLDDWLFGGTGNDVLDAGGGSGNVLIAGSGDDQLVGADGISSDPMNSGSDWLLGGLGSDRLYGQGGDDYFEADQGNDFVEGGAGSDTIIFRTGDGIDRISDNGLDDGDTDVVAFGDDISPDDVEVIASSSSIDMSMLLGYDGDQADLRGAAVTSRAGIEAFDFGTTVWSRGQMTAQAIFAKNAGISVSGTGAGENIAGTRYDDTLSGGDGDTLQGDFGSDEYLFSLGDGTVVIEEAGFGSDLDVLTFGAGITVANIAVSHSAAAAQDIVITVGTGGDQIILRNQLLKSGAQSIEEVRFQDGTSLTLRDIEALAAPVFTNGNDTAWGFDSDDVFSGGDGSDTLAGGRGNDDLIGGGSGDTFIYNSGDGDDRISDGFWDDGTDTLILGAGIAPEDLILTRDVLDSNNLRIRFKTGSGSILLDGQNSGRTAGIEQIQFADGTIWDRATMDAQMVAQSVSAKADIVRTGYVGAQYVARDDVVSAGAGNDIINTGQGVDIITGGAGDDDLAGGSEADTYVYNIGDGDDRIVEGFWDDGTDTLLFGENILPEELIFSRDVLDGNNLRITFTNQVGSILIDGHTSGRAAGIEQIQFADGTIWDRAAIDAQFLAQSQSSGSDIIRTGYYGAQYIARDDVILAGGGRDTIYAGQGVDTITGGVGNDELFGGEEGDTYIYNIGDGDDRVAEEYWGNGVDALQFGAGVSAADLVLSRDVIDPGNLRVSFLNQTGSILIDGQFAGGRSEIEEFRFADGTTWNAAAIAAQMVVQMSSAGSDIIRDSNLGGVIQAGAGNDTVYAGGGADVITGGIGNDDLFGGEDGDTYVYEIGDGHDRIAEDYWGNGDDVLLLGEGIDTSTLVLTTDVLDGNNLRIDFVGQAGSVLVEGQFNQGRNGLEKIQFADGTIWDRTAIGAQVTVRSANIVGTNAAETLSGTVGTDQLYGYNGNDTLAGGTGNDFLNGGGNDDVYLFNLGDGSDTINDDSGTDTIRFGTGISSTDLVLMAPTVDDDFQGLIIAIAGTQDRIYIRNQNANNGRTIERFEFTDGTVLTSTDLRTQLMVALPTSGDDKIRGSEFAETINGGAGDDEIDAYSGADIISGGHGNDYLNGGGGEDVYLFNLGDGSDTINDDSGTDTIRFGAGISSPDLVLMASTVDDDFQGLIIAIAGTQDRIYIRNQNANNGRTIERFEFADGTVLTNTDLRTQLMAGLPTSGDDKIRGSSFADTINGGSGSDEIEGFDGNDILAGGKGDDYLNGGANDDTYIFNRYDGFETIFDDWGNDTLKLGAGIAESDVIVSQALDDGDTSGVILTFKGSDDKIYLRSELDGNRIDTIQFHTGETWNVAGLLNLLRGTTINGKSNPVTMGDDVVIGSAVADTIRGMRGDDALRGGMGSDTYRFARGDGYDTIYDPDEAAATDVLIFEGINSTDVAVMVSPTDPDDIILYVDDENIIYLDQIRDGARSGIDEVRFADGAIWDRQTLLAKASGGQGTTGDNLLIGSNFADSLTGGAGNDRLVGGAGNDVYTYNSGDGNDVIVDMADDASPLASSGDTLSFGAGIALADIRLMRNTADGPLIIAFAGQAGSITLEGTQTDGLSGVQFLKFADGSVHNMADVRQAALNGAATGGNDLIEGFSTADVLAGGTGNDTLIGRGGADVYHFAIGDGQDMIIESDGQANRLIFAAGITSGTLRLYRTIDAPDDLIIALPDGTDKVVLKGQLSSSGKSGLAMIAFADGATWDRDEIIERLLSQPATADADYLVGSDENDSIDGLAGNDFIEGGRGDDLLYGAGGNDILSGGIGADALHGGDGDDILSGDEGLDTLDGGNGYDTADYSFSLDRWNINLATGEAAIIRDSGAAPAETLISFEAVKGGLGSDQITGDDTANRLQGGAGNDILQGGGGDDVFIVEGDEDGIDAVDGGTGYDRMEAAVDGTVFGLSGISNVELITANSHANVRIEATDDNDVLDFSSAVLEGIVSIELGAGDDVITGSLGADAINAGAGNDVIRYVGLSLGGDTVDGSDGSDRIEAGADGAVIRLASFQNVETITGGQFAGVVLARTDAGETTNLNGITVSGLARIDLEGGDDIYVGTAQSEVVRGGSGDDTLSGAAGDDIFDYLGSASGRDSVDGGSGYDRLRASADDAVIGIRSITGVEAIDGNGFANVTLQLTSGNDTLDLNAVTMTGITAIVAGAGNDIIRGSTGDDRFLVSGQGQGLDDIDGGAGQDRILAGASNTAIGLSRLVNVETIDGAGYQNVTIAATSGNDSLSLANVTVTGVERIDLGAGNDSFTGSSGDDIVVGGTGNDQLAGGGGDDSYVFNIGDGQDVVSDTATSTSDRIRFGSGILGDDIQVTKVNADQDLLLTIGTTGDTLLIKEGAVFGTSHGVEYVDFADGTQWSRAQLIAKTYANYAPTAINVSGSLPSPQFTGAGWAAQVSQNEYLLTPNASNRSGAIWGAVDLSADAEWTTRMYFGANDGGADGLSFVLQNSSPTALGSGGALVNGSLGIWFDTYQNGSEPASDFSKIVLNGNVGDQSFDAYHTHGNLENGVWRDVVIQWNADAKSLSYSLDGAVVSSKVYDVVGNLFSGDSTAYFGFGAATGGATNQHSVQLISSTGKTGALAVAEDAIPGTLIGRLATVDANAGDAFTYQIVDQSGTPVADANFILDDNRILIKQGADLETMPQAVYNLNIKTTDAGGASFVQAVQINVTQSHVDVGPTGFELLAPVSYNATRVGSAFKATDSIYQLTPNSGNQTGAIWSAVDLTKDTIWTTKIYLGANDGGADGLAFALQGTSSTALADTGVLTSQSVGIKFDTYTNGNEPAADFSKLVVNGNLTSHAFDLYHTHQNLEDNAWHDVVIRWDADLRSLAYSLDGVLISSRTLDPSNDPLAGLSNAYFGFGAATGGATNLHSVDIRGMMSVVSGFAIQENAASGALVGVVTPVGGAVGSSYSFEFIDENGATVTNAFFEFGSGGELRVRQSAVLDYELEDLHSIRIKATDMGGRSYSATIEVAILDQVGSPLSGSAGNDVLLGTQEGDTISGVAGNDLLVGGSGDDVVNGGDGDDVIHGDGRVPVGPNLVVNSSFEDLGSTADNIRRDWGVESADIAGWTKSNSQPFEANYSGTQGISTSDGAYWLDMTSIDGAQSRMDIQQSFSNLAAGEEFLLQFDVARPSSAGNATIEALWNGVVVATISDAGSQMTTVSRYVTATSATNQLQFRTTAGPNYYGVSLDNVRLFATEPSDGGDDYIDGGLGADIVVFRGDQADYTIATISGTVTITDNAPGVDWDDGTDTLVSVETALFKDSSYNLAAPIVLDLDGDGVNLLDLHQSHARFDWNGDGLADKTGWVAKGDGLLFFDRNGDGEVSGANELSFIEDKPGAKSDLDGLSAFDTNGDGLFDRNDDQWSQFKIWKDINGNGVAASEELFTMADVGIQSISLEGQATAQAWSWESNIVLNHGSFTWEDGRSGTLDDVAMNYIEAKVETHLWEPQAMASRLIEAMAPFDSSSAAAFSIEELEKSRTLDIIASHVRLASGGNFN